MNSKTKSTLLLVLLTITFIICSTFVLAISFKNSESNEVYADDSITYVSRSWDSSSKSVISSIRTCSNYTVVNSETTAWSTGWYVVNSDVTIDSRIEIATNYGTTVNLILCDGATLTASKGIHAKSVYLNIYGQIGGTGALIATSTSSTSSSGAGIGGNSKESGGYIKIYGGNVTAAGEGSGTGIGGGWNGDGRSIEIYGGNVTAIGGRNAPGIGQGGNEYGTSIHVYGGSVTATGGENAPGIGGCGWSANVIIEGGCVTATGGSVTYPGIGGGEYLTNYNSREAYRGYLHVYNVVVLGSNDGIPSDTDVKTDYGDNRWRYMVVKSLHTHSWSYEANNNSIVATCSAEGCINNQVTLTIQGNSTYEYDGLDKQLSISIDTVEDAFGIPTISYYKDNVSVSECVDVGAYEARVTVGGKTAVLPFEITKKNPALDIDYTAPTAKTDLIYTANNQELINAGTAICGTIQYKLGASGTYGESIPVAMAVGDYDVYYKIIGNSNYNDVEETGPIQVSISKPKSEVVAPTGAVNLIYTGDEQELLANHGSATGGTLKYKIDAGAYSEDFPTAIAAGDYTIYYKAFGDDDHNDSDENSLVVSIAKADPTYVIPTGIRTLLGKTLSQVTLPNGWAWVDSSINVGDVVQDKVFAANYTPADTDNYNVMSNIDVTVSVFAHEHAFAYQANGATITATCGNEDCYIIEGLTLTLNAPTDSMVYDGNARAATITAGYNEEAFVNPTIKYYKNDAEVAAADVKTAGVYVAKVIFGQAAARISFEITKADPTYTAPTGLQATYGDLLSSVALTNGWTWKTATNTVGNAGSREHKAIYTPEDITNYNVLTINLTIVVAKANPAYTVPTNIEAPYDVALSTVGLPDGFTWMDGTQQVNNWGENTFKAKFTPEDTANYNKVENIDITVNVKWILVDPTQKEINVEIGDGETIYNINITVKVEVKTEISVEAKQTSYANLAKGFIAKDEDISTIYGVKLIRTTNGVEEEIQPSDIKEGQTIIISMTIPEDLIGKPFRLLHIHSEDDITEVQTSEYSITADGKTVKMEANKLSEFAFVSKIESGDNGFVYEEENAKHGFCVGWVVFIFVMLELLATCLYIIIRYGFLKELVAKCKLTILSDKIDLMTFIGLCVSGAIFLFALIALCCHQCALTIIMFILALIICCAFVYFYLKDKGIIDKCIAKIKDKQEQPNVDDNKEEAIAQIEAEAEEELESSKESDVEEIEAKEKAHEAITLKDSLTLAKATSSSHTFSKKYVADYLRTKDIVEVNERENYTKTGLPLADTHYVDGKDGKKCFAYVYETEGSIILLAKMDDDYAKSLQKKHSQINKSAFPKQKNTWYSLIIDDTYTKEEFEDILDELIGEVKEDAGMSLKESIALAKASTAHSFSKKYVCEYLQDKKDVVVNTRENYTRTGLPLADTHYVIKGDKKICFAYIYEIEGSIILLAKMNTQYAKELQKKHSNVTLSAFPKQADTWYSLIIDDTYSKEEFEKILDDIREQA